MKRLQLIVWAFAAMAIVSQGNAQTLVVSPIGGGDYTTINAAVAAANSGDTILVRAGYYAESISLTKRLNLIGEDLSAELLNPTGNVSVYFDRGSEGSVLRGFVIRGRVESNLSSNPQEEDRVHVLNNHFIDSRLNIYGIFFVANNRFDSYNITNSINVISGGQPNSPVIIANNELNGGCIITHQAVSHLDIVNNQISGYRPSNVDDAAIQINTRELRRDIRIIANRIEDCNVGIHWGMDSGAYNLILENFLVANNTITNCDYGMYFEFRSYNGRTIEAKGTVTNNVIYNTRYSSITHVIINGTIMTPSAIQFLNNIFANPGSLNTLNNFTNSIWRNNNFSQANHIPVVGSGVLESEGNIAATPLFTDPDNGDFTLQNGSPCIDAGIDKGSYSDIDLTRNDMGVYGGSLTQENFIVTNTDAPKLFLLGNPYQSVLRGYPVKIKVAGIAE